MYPTFLLVFQINIKTVHRLALIGLLGGLCEIYSFSSSYRGFCCQP
jgi:hypothetical protein